MAYNVVTKSRRAPTIAVPGSKGNTRPTAQKGGGGNKAAGSVEPTAENTPTVTVNSEGNVRVQNEPDLRHAREEVREAHESRRRVRKVKSYVKQRDKELAPKREVKVSKDFLDRAASPKPVTVSAHKRGETKVVEHSRALPKPSYEKPFTKEELHPKNPLKPPSETPEGRRWQREGEQIAKKAPALKGTPEERQAARAKVVQAKKAVRNSKPVIEADLGPEQERFVEGVAKETRLNPRTIAAQARAEESEGAQTEAEQTHNFLNMGPGISYSSLKEGIDATAHNYNTNPLYEGIRATRGQSPETQARAIAESKWGTGSLIEETLPSVHVRPGDPKAKARLEAAVKEAKELGLKVSPTGIQKPGPAPKQVVTRYKAARSAMAELDKLNNAGKEPYVWGGNHGMPGKYDCSGAVSYVLEKLKILPKGGALVSGDMGSVLKPGPGALTVFYNGEHTFIYDAVKHEFWGTSNSNVEGGPGFFPSEVGESEVAEGNSSGAYQVGHIPGLGKKQALQMGGSLGGLAGGTGSSGSIPGMTVAPSGTTATIEPGAGAKVDGKAKFSKKPIELTPLQQINRRVRRLKHLGVEVAGPGQETKAEAADKPGDSSLHAQLAALESKYSIGAV